MARLALIILVFTTILSTLAQPALVQIKKAAEAGDPKAQKRLAQSYESQLNFSDAELWYKRAAPTGDPDVLLALANFYAGGKPKVTGKSAVPANPKDAIALYSLAAIQGHKRAQHDLAMQYFNGTILPRNKIRAYQLFRLSGNITEKVYLDRLIGEMTTQEIDEAEQEVKAFRPKSFKDAFSEVALARFSLQGIMGTKEKRFALINDKTIEQGQKLEISVGGFPVQVQCEMIAPRSVHLNINGKTEILVLN